MKHEISVDMMKQIVCLGASLTRKRLVSKNGRKYSKGL